MRDFAEVLQLINRSLSRAWSTLIKVWMLLCSNLFPWRTEEPWYDFPRGESRPLGRWGPEIWRSPAAWSFTVAWGRLVILRPLVQSWLAREIMKKGCTRLCLGAAYFITQALCPHRQAMLGSICPRPGLGRTSLGWVARFAVLAVYRDL